ncbi:hypothetical protein PG996_004337 [Apiospora saccharicola]|uniref:Uncharacterized protein n=1 Tax=Apiospora saccharicola TaxID=335842 RepID=A0ABR1W3W9_9PEZI
MRGDLRSSGNDSSSSPLFEVIDRLREKNIRVVVFGKGLANFPDDIVQRGNNIYLDHDVLFFDLNSQEMVTASKMVYEEFSVREVIRNTLPAWDGQHYYHACMLEQLMLISGPLLNLHVIVVLPNHVNKTVNMFASHVGPQQAHATGSPN